MIDDATGISNLYSKVWSDYTDRFPEELLRARTPKPDETVLWLETDTYFIAEIAGKVAGVVGCSFRHGICCLIHMVVDNDYRRQGIGQALVEAVINEAHKLGATKVWLDTLSMLEDAISLYKRNGFKKCGHLRKHLWNLDLELYELVFE
jgi:GNAT superfamily N-acetyltransferase